MKKVWLFRSRRMLSSGCGAYGPRVTFHAARSVCYGAGCSVGGLPGVPSSNRTVGHFGGLPSCAW